MLTGVGDNAEIKEIESLALTLGERKKKLQKGLATENKEGEERGVTWICEGDRKAFKCKRILPVKCNTGNFWFYDDCNVLLQKKYESCMLEKRLLVSTSSAEMLYISLWKRYGR